MRCRSALTPSLSHLMGETAPATAGAGERHDVAPPTALAGIEPAFAGTTKNRPETVGRACPRAIPGHPHPWLGSTLAPPAPGG